MTKTLERPTTLDLEMYGSVIWADMPIPEIAKKITTAETVGDFFSIEHTGEFIDDVVINCHPVDTSAVTPVTAIALRTQTLYAAMELLMGLYEVADVGSHTHLYNKALAQALGVRMALVHGKWVRYDWQRNVKRLVEAPSINQEAINKHNQLDVVLSGQTIVLKAAVTTDENIAGVLEDSLKMTVLEALVDREERIANRARNRLMYGRAQRPGAMAKLEGQDGIIANVNGKKQDLIALGYDQLYKFLEPGSVKPKTALFKDTPGSRSYFNTLASVDTLFIPVETPADEVVFPVSAE